MRSRQHRRFATIPYKRRLIRYCPLPRTYLFELLLLQAAKPAEPILEPRELPVDSGVQPGFNVGKTMALHLEYSVPNGWMSRDEAVQTCEDDLQCGGFTYQGAINATDPALLFYVSFFRSVSHATVNVPDFLAWTTYRVQRSLVLIPGRPLEDLELHNMDKSGHHVPPVTRRTRANLKMLTILSAIDSDRKKRNSLVWPLPDSAAFGINPSTEEVVIADHYDFVSQDLTDPDWYTFLSTDSVHLSKLGHSRGSVETCCKEDGGMGGTLDDFFSESNVPKVPEVQCGDMTAEKFLREYVEMEKVVKLVGCKKTRSKKVVSLNEVAGKLDWWPTYVLSEGATDVKYVNASKLQLLTYLKKGNEFMAKVLLPQNGGNSSSAFGKIGGASPPPEFLPDALLDQRLSLIHI